MPDYLKDILAIANDNHREDGSVAQMIREHIMLGGLGEYYDYARELLHGQGIDPNEYDRIFGIQPAAGAPPELGDEQLSDLSRITIADIGMISKLCYIHADMAQFARKLPGDPNVQNEVRKSREDLVDRVTSTGGDATRAQLAVQAFERALQTRLGQSL